VMNSQKWRIIYRVFKLCDRHRRDTHLFTVRLILMRTVPSYHKIISITILDIIHRPIFYLKLISTQLYKIVRTSQETHYVSATIPVS
jgi:hypothetical protein